MHIVINRNIRTGERTAINPLAISHVNGYGGTYTVYMRDGQHRIDFHDVDHDVADFINAWDEALQSASPEQAGEGAVGQ